MRISGWSSDVCSSDLRVAHREVVLHVEQVGARAEERSGDDARRLFVDRLEPAATRQEPGRVVLGDALDHIGGDVVAPDPGEVGVVARVIGVASGRDRGWEYGASSWGAGASTQK